VAIKEILEKVFSQLSPVEILKAICTPENLQAIAYGATKAALESQKGK
jgi:hypothetical protein